MTEEFVDAFHLYRFRVFRSTMKMTIFALQTFLPHYFSVTILRFQIDRYFSFSFMDFIIRNHLQLTYTEPNSNNHIHI